MYFQEISVKYRIFFNLNWFFRTWMKRQERELRLNARHRLLRKISHSDSTLPMRYVQAFYNSSAHWVSYKWLPLQSYDGISLTVPRFPFCRRSRSCRPWSTETRVWRWETSGRERCPRRSTSYRRSTTTKSTRSGWTARAGWSPR